MFGILPIAHAGDGLLSQLLYQTIFSNTTFMYSNITHLQEDLTIRCYNLNKSHDLIKYNWNNFLNYFCVITTRWGSLVHDSPPPPANSTLLYSVHSLFLRTTGPVLTSDKEEKQGILSTTLNFAVRRGKLSTYTLQKPPEVFWKFAPSGGYKECTVVCFA